MADDPARWQRLESIVVAALARAAEERPAFLADACGGDDDLRREAASLLERASRADGFLANPLDALAAGEQSRGPALVIGQTIAHYRIVKAIGAGGMGEIYLAEDTRLDRQVALKILPTELADDASRRSRFAREAKAVAALNHPNIVTVHAVEEADGLHFITMELVRGRTLAERLPPTGFALGSFFDIAIPLADAIAAAHQQGITHRDLKPTNVMLSDEGRVKVLDFGLAKVQPDVRNRNAGLATRSATGDGHIVGTPAYMSPEQAEGKTVDARSDIFSLGIVFYEMLTGERPFGGDSPTRVLSSIVKDTPRPLGEIKPAMPRRLARLVHRCLEKNPVDRYQSAIDLRHDLEETQRDDAPVAATSSRVTVAGGRRRTAIALGLGVLIVAAGAASIWPSGNRGGVSSEAVPRLQNAVQLTSALTIEGYPTWSPDGQRLAYEVAELGFNSSDNRDIWVAQLGSGEPVNLTPGSLANDRRPSWSPDGREIAFLSNREGDWGVYLVAAIGGSPRKVLALPGLDGASTHAPQWLKDGTTLFVMAREANRNFVVTLSLESLQTTRVMLPEHSSPRTWELAVRADGRRFAYVEAGGGNPDLSRLWTIAASGGDPVPLTDGRTKVWSPTWSADGGKVFYAANRGGGMDLWQQAVDTGGAPIGEPLSVTQGGLGITSAVFSPDGTKLAYARGGTVSNVWRVPIPVDDRPAVWADAVSITSEHAYLEFVDVSPDGKQLAVSSDRRGNQDLWILPSTGGEMTPLTNDPTPDWDPQWSPDGSEIAFYAYRSGNRDIWVMPSSGGPARQLTSQPGFDWFPRWSPDGREIAFGTQPPNNVAIVNAAGGDPPRLLTEGSAPAWSPDGHWLIFAQDGRLFRIARDGGERSLVRTPHSPAEPRFSRDGQSIYFSVTGGPSEHHGIWKTSLRDGTSTRLTRLEGRRGALGYRYSFDDHYFYFTWVEHEGDIWVMNVATDDRK
jgi:Tol biopolymer transport system component